jgi:hypothetical protein
VEKCARAGQSADGYIIRHIRFACWITEATYTHWEYIFIAFRRQQWLLERALQLRYITVPVLWKCKVFFLWTLCIWSTVRTSQRIPPISSCCLVVCSQNPMKHTLCGGWGIFAILKQYIYCSYDWALSGYCSSYFSHGCSAIPWTSLLVLLTGCLQGLPTDVSSRCSQIFTKVARWSASPRIRIGVHG